MQPDDPAALAQGIQHLLAEPALAARLAAQAQEEVQAYTWEQRAERILSFVEGTCLSQRLERPLPIKCVLSLFP